MSSTVSPQEIRDVYARAEQIYSKVDIEAAYDRMADAISERLRESNPVVMAVMVGGMIPAGQLLPRLDFPLQIDYLHATRYRGGIHGADLQWLVRPSSSLQDKVVAMSPKHSHLRKDFSER